MNPGGKISPWQVEVLLVVDEGEQARGRGPRGDQVGAGADGDPPLRLRGRDAEEGVGPGLADDLTGPERGRDGQRLDRSAKGLQGEGGVGGDDIDPAEERDARVGASGQFELDDIASLGQGVFHGMRGHATPTGWRTDE